MIHPAAIGANPLRKRRPQHSAEQSASLYKLGLNGKLAVSTACPDASAFRLATNFSERSTTAPTATSAASVRSPRLSATFAAVALHSRPSRERQTIAAPSNPMPKLGLMPLPAIDPMARNLNEQQRRLGGAR
jgi:hypothetical protein